MTAPETAHLPAGTGAQPSAEPMAAETPLPELVTDEGQDPAAEDQETPKPYPAEAFVVEAEGLGPDEVTRILEKRARDLAQIPPAEESREVIQVITFALGDETYAIEAPYVGGVHRLEGLTPVPCTPEFCAGVVSLRGRILSVVDIHRFLGLPGTMATSTTEVIVVHATGLDVGILADQVLEVRSLPLVELQPALPTTSRVAAEYTRGVTPDMLVLLDLPALLGDGRIVVREEIVV